MGKPYPDDTERGTRMVQQYAWKAVGAGAGIAAAAVTRAALKSGWKALKKTDPPSNPASPRTTWPEALTWAASTGVALGVARVVAQRGAAEGWRRTTGSLPPGLEEVA